MRQAVKDTFLKWSEKFEGAVSWMYLDVKGLVTTGIGNLVDPYQEGHPGPYTAPNSVLFLPWTFKSDGRAATEKEIADEWLAVKVHKTAAKQGHRVLEKVTNLRLSEEAIQNLVLSKAAQNETILHKRFPSFDEWPAEAQLATHSMAWACGAMFRFPRLADALNAQDFNKAAQECRINDTNNPGVTPRNAANKELYETAQWVKDAGEDKNVLRLEDGTEVAPQVTDGGSRDGEPFGVDGGIIHPDQDWSQIYEDSKKAQEQE